MRPQRHRAACRLMAALALSFGLLHGPAGAAGNVTLNVAAIPIDPSANVYYALQQGYFQSAGLDVHIIPMTSGPAVVAAIASGSVDIGVSNVTSLAAARLHGIMLRFIAPAAITTPDTRTDLLLVPKDSPIQTAADLNGKTVAIGGIKSFQQVSASAWIDKHGGDAHTIKFIEVPFPEMGAALAAHRVDAAMTTEPFSSADLASARSLGQPLQAVATTYMLLGWAATDDWLRTHAESAARFATAMRQASRWANGHHKESAAILVKYTGIPQAVADKMARTAYGTDVTTALISPPVDASVRYGIIDKVVPSEDLIWHP